MKVNRLVRGKLALIVTFAIVAGLALSCSPAANSSFSIVAGSENAELEPMVRDFAKTKGVDVKFTFKGSLDMMQDLSLSEFPYDAIWPANSLWLNLGDQKRIVKYASSIVTSPVVFGIKKSKAEALGWVGKKVSIRDILEAIRSKRLTFAMTSATQSNSGASAYLGFLNALAGSPDVLSSADLDKPQLGTELKELLAGVNRLSGSSGWLKDLFLAGDYDAMVNYEFLIMETNQELLKQGKEALYVVYPSDGTVISDFTLGFVSHGDPAKEEFFKSLQAYLQGPDAQKILAGLGRRTGIGGSAENADPAVFRADWGIDPARVLNPLRLPQEDVIRKALLLYQTEFKKPSFTVYALDYSGSMEGSGHDQLEQAMNLVLDQNEAAKYLLQTGSRDRTAVVAFSDVILDEWSEDGNADSALSGLLDKIKELKPQGKTDIYSPIIEGLRLISEAGDSYSPSIILMTDGESNSGKSLDDLEASYKSLGRDIPLFAIMFGDANQDQLDAIAQLGRGRVFDGRTDLVSAFKSVRGYN